MSLKWPSAEFEINSNVQSSSDLEITWSIDFEMTLKWLWTLNFEVRLSVDQTTTVWNHLEFSILKWSILKWLRNNPKITLCRPNLEMSLKEPWNALGMTLKWPQHGLEMTSAWPWNDLSRSTLQAFTGAPPTTSRPVPRTPPSSSPRVWPFWWLQSLRATTSLGAAAKVLTRRWTERQNSALPISCVLKLGFRLTPGQPGPSRVPWCCAFPKLLSVPRVSSLFCCRDAPWAK